MKKHRPRVFVNKSKAKTLHLTEFQELQPGPSTTPQKPPEDFDLEDERITDAFIKMEQTMEAGGSLEKLIMKEAAAAGLIGSRDFDRLLRQTKGKRVPRGTSDDSRPQRPNQNQQQNGSNGGGPPKRPSRPSQPQQGGNK